MILVVGTAQVGRGDATMIVPHGGPQGVPPQTGTQFPFLISQAFPGSGIPTMRYQQVYNSSLFTNVDPSLIYIVGNEVTSHSRERQLKGRFTPPSFD